MFVTLSTYFYVGVRMLNHSHKDVVYTNADERRYKPVMNFISIFNGKFFSKTYLGAAHRKVRKERKAQPQFRTRMTRIARIFTDMCASAQSASYRIYSLIDEDINPQISQIRADLSNGGQTLWAH